MLNDTFTYLSSIYDNLFFSMVTLLNFKIQLIYLKRSKYFKLQTLFIKLFKLIGSIYLTSCTYNSKIRIISCLSSKASFNVSSLG